MNSSRNTIAKNAIAHLLSESAVALSHSEIQAELDGLCDRVTIYRVLERLVTEHAIHKVVNVDGVIKYAPCHDCQKKKHRHAHDHIHFSCENCQEVTCLEGVIPEFHLPKKYKLSSVHFTVSGLCPKCS